MNTYVSIDLETTGLDPKKDQITQIAAIKYDENGKKVGQFDTFVQLTGDRKPSPYTPNITEEMCATGMVEEEAVLRLDDFVSGSTLIIQYAPFDLAFLKEKHSYGSPIEQFNDFYCTRFMAKNLWFDHNPSLSHLAKRLNILNENHHDAINDCEVAFKAFWFMKRIMDSNFNSVNSLINSVGDFKDRPLRYKPYGSKVYVEFENCFHLKECEWS